MKNRTKTIIILSCALGACLTLALGACAGADTREGTLSRLVKQGRNVIVHYDKNGGIVGGDEKYDFFDALRYDDVADGGVKLLEPGDPDRGSNNAGTSTATRSGYTLVGWYRERLPRVDKDGNPLDDEGNICYIPRVVTENGVAVRDEEGNLCFEYVSDAGKPQAYSYEGLWDFGKDRVTLDDLQDEEYDKGKTVKAFRLYAAWAPNYTYDFYRLNEANEWEQYATLTKPAAVDQIDIPTWDDAAGSIDYGSMPRYAIEADEEKGIPAQNFTLTALYADPECKQPYADGDMLNVYERSIPHHGITDYETGTATGTSVKLYTTWKEGNWFRISTASQLATNAYPDGCYEILSDLNCSEILWNFSNFTFTGTFQGNGHTLYNITSRQTDARSENPQLVHGGLFGTFTEEAHLQDIAFENVSYTIEAGARPSKGGSKKGSFGLFAGEVSDKVTAANFEGVKVSGNLYVGGRDLISVSGAKAGTSIKTFTVGIVAGNVLGEDLEAFLNFDIEAKIDAQAATHIYSQDKYGNPIYGKTLSVSWAKESSEDFEYGQVIMTVLEEPIQEEA